MNFVDDQDRKSRGIHYKRIIVAEAILDDRISKSILTGYTKDALYQNKSRGLTGRLQL